MSLPSVSDSFKPKSFWERPEGTSGMIAIGGLCVIGYFIAIPVLTTLTGIFTLGIGLLGKAITMTILAATLTALLLILTNSKFITLMSYMFKSAMRAITGQFVEIDPIGIMKNYISDMKKWISDLDNSILKLRGQKRILENKITANDSNYNDAMKMVKIAKENGKSGVLQVNARQAGRLQKVNTESYKPLLSTINAHLRTLEKYREVSDIVVSDLTNEVEVKSDQRDMIRASHSAMKTAMKIIRGDADKKELFDRAMESVVNDYGSKLGEIEHFMSTSKNFVDGLDMQNGMFEADALEKLLEWENKADSILLDGNTKTLLLEQSTADLDYNRFGLTAQPEKVTAEYSKWFTSK